MRDKVNNSPDKLCFADGARETVQRLHLPVAPRPASRVRFGPPKPPGAPLPPAAALHWLDEVVRGGADIQVVGVTGPGDPLITAEDTIETLAAVRRGHPGLALCLTTLGLGAADLAPRLAELELSHVTLLVDAISAETARKLYAWIRPGKKNIPLAEAAPLLVDEQARAIEALAARGITVKVNTTVYPGVNDPEVEAIAAQAARLGASIMRLIPYDPPPGLEEDHPDPPTPQLMDELRHKAARHIELMPQLAGCGGDLIPEQGPSVQAPGRPKPSRQRPHLAVCTSNGFEVDLHLGQASQFMIYGPKDGPVILLDSRPAPEPNSGDARWAEVALTLSDCFAVLASHAGERPRQVLAEKGLPVIIQTGDIEGLVDTLFGGGKKKGKGRV